MYPLFYTGMKYYVGEWEPKLRVFEPRRMQEIGGWNCILSKAVPLQALAQRVPGS